MEVFVDDPSALDVPLPRIELEVLRHRRIRVEAHLRQAEFDCVPFGTIKKRSPVPTTLGTRQDRKVLEEKMITLVPADYHTEEAVGVFQDPHHGEGEFAGVVGRHGRWLATDSPDVLPIGGGYGCSIAGTSACIALRIAAATRPGYPPF